MNPVSKYLTIFMLLELILFILIWNLIGFLSTLLLFFSTTILGILLIRKQSKIMLARFQTSVQTKTPLFLEETHSSLVIIGGILLIIPGFLTDLIGILCLIPKMNLTLSKPLLKTPFFAQNSSSHRIIEGEYSENDSCSKENKEIK